MTMAEIKKGKDFDTMGWQPKISVGGVGENLTTTARPFPEQT